MLEIGFTLSSEEQQPADLARLAALSEDAGFSFVTISDHFHPWVSQQGNSPFVEAIREFERAGYDHVFVHQVGPDQEGGLRFLAEEVLPRLESGHARKAS